MDGKNAMGIYAKLVGIRSEFKGMEKGGTNEQQGYSYFSDDQISEKFRSLFDIYKVCFVYSSKITGCREISPTRSGTKQFVTDVLIDYKFIDSDDGSMIEGTACGSGNDTGDKGVYKAITGAVKYIFMKTFQISTGDDPEKDNVKEWTPKEKETEKKDVPFTGNKPVFDEKSFENFKQAVILGKMEADDEAINKIKDKFDVAPSRAMKIVAFIKTYKDAGNGSSTNPEK